MTLDNIQVLVTIALVILIVVFLFKKAIKLAIAIGAILILFNVGFMMNGAEVRNFFNLDNFLSQEQANAVEDAFDDFDSKREEYGVIDPDKVYDGMTDAIATGTSILIEGIGRVDIVAFSETVAEKLINAGAENVDREELENSIRNQLKGIKDSDLEKIMSMIEKNLESEKESSTEVNDSTTN